MKGEGRINGDYNTLVIQSIKNIASLTDLKKLIFRLIGKFLSSSGGDRKLKMIDVDFILKSI